VVERVAAALNYDLDAVFEIHGGKAVFPTPCTVRQALTNYVDLSGIPRKSVLKALAAFAQNAADKDRLLFLAGKAGKAEYEKFVREDGRSLAELISECFPSLAIPLEHFINTAPYLQPRYYTISSSSSVHPQSIHITVAVTRDEVRPGRVHLGVCSSYLASLRAGQSVRVFVRPSGFRLPASPSTPVILVGPGTGIAPMRALCQERRFQRLVERAGVGETVLFFGCKRRDHDFLYEEELMGFRGDSTLSDLQLAFSREQHQKVYVQHRITDPQTARDLWQLLSRGAHVYVCGGNKMGADVKAAFESVAKVAGGLNDRAASDFVKGLESANERRYVQELWSA
jgi:NADPH-ferrihemoprotein reductase